MILLRNMDSEAFIKEVAASNAILPGDKELLIRITSSLSADQRIKIAKVLEEGEEKISWIFSQARCQYHVPDPQ